MKNYINLIFALFLVAFTACSKDDEIPYTGDPVNVVEETAGTYTGTWTVTNEDGAVMGTYPGTLTVSKYAAAPEEYYACTLTLTCNGYDEIGGTCAANILKQSRAYRFYNEVSSNGIGSTFTGTITFDWACTMSYKKTVTEGRKKVTYFFDFDGSK